MLGLRSSERLHASSNPRQMCMHVLIASTCYEMHTFQQKHKVGSRHFWYKKLCNSMRVKLHKDKTNEVLSQVPKALFSPHPRKLCKCI